MNYYNPYYMMSPIPQTSRISSLFGKGGINFNTLLNGAQRVLGLANQALPLIKEAAPMMRNAKTMFKVMNEFKKIDTPSKSKTEKSNGDIKSNNRELTNNGPTFFAWKKTTRKKVVFMFKRIYLP